MINVLVNAYAVSPVWGSEPGMGWNWIINIAKYCNVYVITESEWKVDILNAVQQLPQKDNLHFYFNPVSEKVRRMCWNQGDWRFYWYYRKWQKKTLEIAKEIVSKNRINVMHQLNMIGFREPGYLWKIKDIPLVWGPIGGMGGMSQVPKSYLESMGCKQKYFNILKLFLTDFQIKFHPGVKKMVRNAYLIGAVKSVQDKIWKYHKENVELINETGTYLTATTPKSYNSEKFEILWVGRLIPTKRLDIALKTISRVKNANVQLTICGVGSDKDERKYKEMINELKIQNRVKWLGKVNHNQIASLMRDSDLFFMTSIADATSTVVVEAITECLPILSFNACGFGVLVKEFAGEVIELTNPEDSVSAFAEKIDFLIDHRERLEEIRNNQSNNRHRLSWDYKAKRLVEIYTTLIQDKNASR